ncbi:MAG: bifunctional 3-deoxy-7-phosphoheptulonate synthase/chorismate mutase type II [Saprospiraceae bacterium]|nr:bifunctional 3-deoxy-7-phosphoheptulonate synthase/chorismate mutase type II [Saprospiraceae bacterium]MBK8668129.1 bifunctional 3-deoxy-7-phosphoheptulonate synthase/chorismate mutase type II [Saprospiraceae bacterium]
MNWINNGKKPILIAGPCSAETEEQVIQTATRLFRTGKVDVLRAGIWKPRTRPGAFEGIGTKGLPWLQKAKELTGLPVAVEVAKASHVELCLEFGIDILWIGARTTVNPFAVQEIADSLKGVDIPVLLKNPINPDLALWLGGMERLQNAGLTKLGAIHRGFSSAGEKIYRNRPQWQIAIDFKTAMPELPMINDPSHITGRRDLLFKVAQKAMDLNFDGLMIESHVNPDAAWSDAAQQITPEVYGQLISDLVIREYDPINLKEKTKLDRLRKEIDMIDEEIMSILASRMKIAREIGSFKKDNNMTILQNDRWQEVLHKFVDRGTQNGLSEDFITRVIKSIHDESIEQQEKVMTGE